MSMPLDIPAYDPTDFVCQNCELPAMQSPTWEELCVHCTILFLECDLEINRKAMNDAV
jgi:hypothetical protein